MSTVYSLCSFVLPAKVGKDGAKVNGAKGEQGVDFELEHLLMLEKGTIGDRGQETQEKGTQKATVKKPKEELNEILEALDVFKGVLVLFMTYSHVNLVLVNPADATYGTMGHFVGNVASSMCFLGFMFCYGFACDCMYISNTKNRTLTELCSRVGRSICLPIIGALVCSFSWSFLCFKFPLTFEMVVSLLSFYNLVGNGPDFIMSFVTMLLIMFPLRNVINRYWDSGNMAHRELLAVILLLVPLSLTFLHVEDCTGTRKYINMLLECTKREPWSANICALPHLFYFNLGLISSRLLREYGIASFSPFWATTLGMGFAFLAIPLFSVWQISYGNIMAQTPFGMVTRGFTNGPSQWWLVGNMFSIYCLLLASWSFHRRHLSEWISNELQHLGANILLYLVCADIILAGSYRPQATPNDAFPLSVFPGGFLVTMLILVATRFIHYLGHSSRK